MTTTPTPASQPAPAANVEKLARAVVATYDDPHLSPVAVERAVGMLRDALEQPSPARSDKEADNGHDFDAKGVCKRCCLYQRAAQSYPCNSAAKAQESASSGNTPEQEVARLSREIAHQLANLDDFSTIDPETLSLAEKVVAARGRSTTAGQAQESATSDYDVAIELAHRWKARAEKAEAALAESAPSSDSIATWEQRALEDGRKQVLATYCIAEISDLRAALARRATAGTTDAPSGETSNVIAGFTEWMRDTSNYPHNDDRRKSFDAFDAGAAWARRATASNAARQYQRKVDGKIIARRDAEIAELKAATAAPGDLPPLPAASGRRLVPGRKGDPELLFNADRMREYGRACNQDLGIADKLMEVAAECAAQIRRAAPSNPPAKEPK
jgi:hypothetical protein